jgi:hypothetical protein
MSDPLRPLSADDKPFESSGESKPFPTGKIFEADLDTWYNLKAHYTDYNGNPTSGLMYPLAPNPSTTYWDYMTLGFSPMDLPPAKIKLKYEHFWELDDGNYLSIKATGWVYRSSAYPIPWKIIDNYLYNGYWEGKAGYSYRSGLEPNAYYIGMGLTPFTCELVPAE